MLTSHSPVPSGRSLLRLFFLASLANVGGSNSWDQKCGWATINPENTICCNGLIYVRGGIQPTCCGNIAYDAFSSYCCNGRVQAKTKNNRCCGQSTYDKRYQVCHPGDYVMQRQLPGSKCCRKDQQWTCCRHGQNCCRGGGSVDIPGFRPACCDITTRSTKARCCSAITQKTGVMPSCCFSDRVKPTCCKTSTSSFECCHSTYGLPQCCQTENRYHPYHPNTTPAPSHLVPVQPTPFPQSGSCCLSRSPQPSCCQAMRPNTGSHQPQYHVRPSKPRCCTYRFTCCAVRNNERQSQCCKTSANRARPLCCGSNMNPLPTRRPPTRRLLQQHKCYSCKLNGNNPESVPLVSSEEDRSYDSGHKQTDYSSTGGGPGWARLSCCHSNYHTQCCRNAHRLTGIYAECCDVSDIKSGFSGGHPRGNSGQARRSLTSYGKRKARCSGRPYDGSYQICCRGMLRRKAGSTATCCGTLAFNYDTHKCCSGTVKRSCSADGGGNRSINWT